MKGVIMLISTLEKRASKIPSMNWQTVKDKLREYAQQVEDGQVIVEVGTWLGACTAAMMLGLKESGKTDVIIHMYDRFATYLSQIEKAAKFGVVLENNKSYLEMVEKTLKPFEIPFITHRGDIKSAKYKDKHKIGLFVDDASKKSKAFLHTMKTFSPFFIPGKTIVGLLDFHYWEKKPGKGYECQRDFMEANKKHYKYLFRIENSDGQKSSEAFFLFLG
jgi:hypothetical protein